MLLSPCFMQHFPLALQCTVQTLHSMISPQNRHVISSCFSRITWGFPLWAAWETAQTMLSCKCLLPWTSEKWAYLQGHGWRLYRSSGCLGISCCCARLTAPERVTVQFIVKRPFNRGNIWRVKPPLHSLKAKEKVKWEDELLTMLSGKR